MPPFVRIDYLAISWAVSRSRDTLGYNICRLDVRSSGKRHRCIGGGYDMVGTVLGAWLQEAHQERLQASAHLLGGMYGVRVDRAAVALDGATGVTSMESVAAALGISLTRTFNRKGHTTGYVVADFGSAEGLQANR